MKNQSLILIVLMLLAVGFIGCEEEQDLPFETRGAIISPSNVLGFFDKTDPSSVYSFDATAIGEAVSSFDILKSYNGGDPVTHSSGNQAGSTISLTLAEALQGLNVDIDDLNIGDQIIFSFGNIQTGTGIYPSQTSTAANVACVSALAGEYTVTTTYGYHDFLPDYNPNTLDVVEIEEIGTGKYKISDFSGGLYSVGPYASAYGTTDLEVEFSDVCNVISWEGQSDPWGTLVPLENGVNSVDAATGVITISWFCNGYGENGVSVYTPL